MTGKYELFVCRHIRKENLGEIVLFSEIKLHDKGSSGTDQAVPVSEVNRAAP